MYRNGEEGKAEVFNYIALFYHPTRRHGNNNELSPMDLTELFFDTMQGLGKKTLLISVI